MVALWNALDGSQHPFGVKTEATVYSLAFDPSSKILFIGCIDGKLHAVNTISMAEQKSWILDKNGIFDLKIDAKRNRILAAGGNGVLTVIEAQTLKVLRSIPLSDGKLRRMAIHTDGNSIAIADNHGEVHLLNAEDYSTIESIQAHKEGCTAVAWHPSKPVLLTGGKDGIVRCWNANTNYEQVLQLAAHQSTIYDIVYHEEANQFVSCSRDKTIKWWDANTFDALRKVDSSGGGHKFSVNRIIVQGRLLISASDDRGVLVFGA